MEGGLSSHVGYVLRSACLLTLTTSPYFDDLEEEDLVSVLSVLLTALVIEARVASPSALFVPPSDWGGGGGGSWGDPAGECKHGSGVVTGHTGTVGCGCFVCLCGNGALALNMVW